MLPIPSKKFIPKIFEDDSKTTSLTNKIDTHLEEWKGDILDLQRLVRSAECPSFYLDELGFFLNAGITQSDSEAQKRKKIYNAVSTHRVAGTFKYDVKIRIDIITGLDAEIVHMIDTDESVIMGGAEIAPYPTYYWGTIGCDGVDLSLGEWIFGSGDELPLAGNVLINCHQGITTPTLTASQIQKITDEIAFDIIPVYFIIYLGYVDGSGVFQIYAKLD